MRDIDINQILQTSVPQWNQVVFLFLEPQPWRAPSIQSELARTDTSDIQVRFGQEPSDVRAVTDYRCRSMSTTREIHDQVRTGQVAGVILMVDQQVRDCLLFLGRLNRLCRPSPPVLMMIPHDTLALTPLMMESGASAVMMQTATDGRIADWCRRVAISRQRNQ